MTCRLGGLDYDIAASAGWYSAMAGLLAGFALLAILLPLDNQSASDDERSTADSVVIFTCAFFALLILGLAYAALSGHAGDGPATGVAAHVQLLNGAVFGLAVLLLLFGLRSVLSSYGSNAAVFSSARSVMLGVTATLGPLVVLALQFANALDLERYRTGLAGPAAECAVGGLPKGVWINFAIIGAAMVTVLALRFVRERLPHSLTAAKGVAKATLLLAVAVAIRSSIAVPLLSTDFITSALFEHITLAATALGTVVVAAAALAAR